MIIIMFLAVKKNHHTIIKEGKKYSVYIWKYYGEKSFCSFVFKGFALNM